MRFSHTRLDAPPVLPDFDFSSAQSVKPRPDTDHSRLTSEGTQDSKDPGTSGNSDSSASTPVPVPSKATVTKRMKLYAALIELADTERKYADDLGILVLIFFENLSRCAYFAQPSLQGRETGLSGSASPGDTLPAVDSKSQAQLQHHEHQVAEQRWKLESVTRNAEAILRLHQLLSARLDKILADHNILPQGPHRRAQSASMAISFSSPGADALDAGLSTSLPVMAMSPALDEAVIDVAHELIKFVRYLARYTYRPYISESCILLTFVNCALHGRLPA